MLLIKLKIVFVTKLKNYGRVKIKAKDRFSNLLNK